MKDVEAERDDLARRCRQLEAEVMSLRHANEQAMEMHSVALEERSKVSQAVTHMHVRTYLHGLFVLLLFLLIKE